MLVAIFGESCTGKSTLAEKLSTSLSAKVYTGKDYLRFAKNEASAKIAFQEFLSAAVCGENVIYVIAQPELLSLVPDGAIRVLVTADISIIKERFSRRMGGHLPQPVEMMLERNHGVFDCQPHDFHLDASVGDPEAVCNKILQRCK